MEYKCNSYYCLDTNDKGGGTPQGMKADIISGRIVKVANNLVDITILTIIVLLVLFAGYALWDSNQINQAADKANYEVYKPTVENEGKSFKELQALNSEVLAWLTVYGTSIDYPVTQGRDNMKYVNTSAEGKYSLSGAIFLDFENDGFHDFNSVLYGHHMAKRAMFGEIDEFSEKGKFDSYRYGNLYYEGQDYGIEFFCFLHADAYDESVFNAKLKNSERQKYLNNLYDKALQWRDIGVDIDERIILLSTCSSDSTNGRDILVGRITNEVYEDMTNNADDKKQVTAGPHETVEETPKLLLLLIIILAMLSIIKTVSVFYERRKY